MSSLRLQTTLGTLWLCALVVVPASSHAQEAKQTKQDKGLDVKVRFDTDLVYDSNVFYFSDRQENRFDNNSAANQVNGRFDKMDSADDWIWRPEVSVDFEFDGLGKKNDLHVEPWVAYELYFLNGPRRHMETGIDLRHELPGKQDLRAGVEYTSKQLRRNYFVDSVTPGDLDVNTNERVYSPGTYSSWEAEASYQRRLWSGKSKGRAWAPRRLVGEAGVQYATRRFNEIHDNRDFDEIGPFAELRTVGKRWDVSLGYAFGDRDAPGNFENVLSDGGPGITVVDSVEVDRSRQDHTVALEWRYKPFKKTRVKAGYEWRLSDYQSDNPLDLSYFRREDNRHRIELGAEYRWDKAVRFEAGIRWTDDNTVAPADDVADAEDDDYSQIRVRLGASVRF